MNDEMKKTDYSAEDQEILQLLEMLSQVPEAPVPDEFDLRLRRALKQEKARQKKAVWKKWTAVAACLMMVVLSVHMIDSGVGLDMATMESAAEETGENSGPTAVLKANHLETADVQTREVDGNAETEEVPEEPSLVSEIQDGAMTYEIKDQNSSQGTGIGLDGERIQLSRGQNSSEERESFSADCDHVINLFIQGIVEDDSEKLAAAVNYKNQLEFSEESAAMTMKLYRDLFQETASDLSWKNINVTGWSRSNIYRLTDGTKDLMVIIRSDADGMKLMEPILERTQWLYDQIGEQDFTLREVNYLSEEEALEFLVDLNGKKKEVRSFVWKETESL